MTKPEILLLRGIPASGKTTYALELLKKDSEFTRVNRDSIRKEVFGTDGVLSFEDESVITKIEQYTVRSLLKAGRSVVIDDMNLRPKYVKEWFKIAKEYGALFNTLEFPVSLEDAIERDNNRARKVGTTAISDIYHRFTNKGKIMKVDLSDLKASKSTLKAYVPDLDKPAAVLVDIDGTVALMGDRRGPHDFHKVSLDEPNLPVIQAVQHAWISGAKIIFMSGRKELCRQDTMLWIKENLSFLGTIWDIDLFMRPDDDNRPDGIFKPECFDKNIRDNYNVLYALDDRDSVVEAYRSMGLTVLQVNYGNF